MGFLNLFKNVGRVADAKAQKAAEKIEEDNAVEFGQQDIAQMKKDLRTIKGNIGTIKGEIAVLEDKKKGVQSAIEKHTADATALAESNQTELAEQHMQKVITLEGQITTFQTAIDTQNNILQDQIKNKNELQQAIDQAEADLVTTKAMVDASKANENLAKVSSSSGSSALAAFKERQEAAKKRLIKSQALKEEGSGDDSLEAQTAKVLGSNQAKDRLAALLAKKKEA
jgi:phage shock protein A